MDISIGNAVDMCRGHVPWTCAETCVCTCVETCVWTVVETCVETCRDMCRHVCRHLCVGMCRDVYRHVCIDQRRRNNECWTGRSICAIGMRTNACIGMWIGMCIDMCMVQLTQLNRHRNQPFHIEPSYTELRQS